MLAGWLNYLNDSCNHINMAEMIGFSTYAKSHQRNSFDDFILYHTHTFSVSMASLSKKTDKVMLIVLCFYTDF